MDQHQQPATGQPPVGSILPWYFPGISGHKAIYGKLPRNWVLCDGSTLDAFHFLKLKQEDVDPDWFGKCVPDLTGRFLAGVDPASPVDLVPRGAAETLELDINTRSAGTHRHTVPASTSGLIANSDVPDPEQPYRTWDDNEHGSPAAHLRVDTDAGKKEGQHRHLLPAIELAPSGDHSHQVTLPPLPTIPPFIGLWFIIRIK